MKKFLSIVCRFWWLWPLLFLVCQYVMYSASIGYTMTVLSNICFVVAIVTALLQITCLICFDYNFKHGKMVVTLMAGIVCFIVMIMTMFTTLFDNGKEDHFGADHPIPEGLEYNEPLYPYDIVVTDEDGNIVSDCNGNDSIVPAKDPVSCICPDDTSSWLVLQTGFQGGIYKYYLYVPELPAGQVWLECYEITDNVRLSISTDRTIQEINPDSCSRVLPPCEFTIYNGIWGEHYAARIEAWYKDSATRHKRKLAESVYKVEGWMR